jgi:hypothetical protein
VRSSLPLSKARRVNSPGVCRPEAIAAAQGAGQRVDNGPAAVDVKLDRVLAGEA